LLHLSGCGISGKRRGHLSAESERQRAAGDRVGDPLKFIDLQREKYAITIPNRQILLFRRSGFFSIASINFGSSAVSSAVHSVRI